MLDPSNTLNPFAVAVPEIFLTAAICVVLLFEAFFGAKRRGATATLTLFVLVIGAALTVVYANVT